MPDNFDTNIAKRKPNMASRPRPVHPWDVIKLPQDDEVYDSAEESTPVESVEKTPEPAVTEELPPTTPAKKQPTPVAEVRKTPVTSRKVAEVQPKRAHTIDRGAVNDLSDSINIHSNYCKLDNDVSDLLLCKLSASAQSVYIRLYRQSFGWNRNWAAESLPKLTKSCNLSLQTIRKSIKELELVGCIKKEFSDYHKATVYRVYLPSEIGMSKSGGLISDSAPKGGESIDSLYDSAQNNDGLNISTGGLKNLEGDGTVSGGQESAIHSIYFAETSIYALIESEGNLPKNISKYITYTHMKDAVDIIDEFYDSIGFSIVSRALYRKSIMDYIDLVKSGLSPDDIRYGVRWTFKNSRSRPESFSLIKHTIHLAMESLIDDLKSITGEKGEIEKKQETLRKNAEWRNKQASDSVSGADMKKWLSVSEALKEKLNEHSFSAFIEPLKLIAVKGNSVTLSSPPDSVSWVNDHYIDRIEESYLEKTSEKVTVIVT